MPIFGTRYTRKARIFTAVSDCDLAVSACKTGVADTGVVVYKINTRPCIKKKPKKKKQKQKKKKITFIWTMRLEGLMVWH